MKTTQKTIYVYEINTKYSHKIDEKLQSVILGTGISQ